MWLQEDGEKLAPCKRADVGASSIMKNLQFESWAAGLYTKNGELYLPFDFCPCPMLAEVDAIERQIHGASALQFTVKSFLKKRFYLHCGCGFAKYKAVYYYALLKIFSRQPHSGNNISHGNCRDGYSLSKSVYEWETPWSCSVAYQQFKAELLHMSFQNEETVSQMLIRPWPPDGWRIIPFGQLPMKN